MELVKFTGWVGSYATFSLKRGIMPNGILIERILVAHEGVWATPEGMNCHPEYRLYEDVQQDLGKGLEFAGKEYSRFSNRSLFMYNFNSSDENEYILAVPASGEEINFKIYGMDAHGALTLLVEREL